MIVAVVAVRMVQMASDEEVDVTSVRNPLVSTAFAVHVCRVMLVARVLGRAAVRVVRVDGERVLVDVVAVGMMQMPVVQVVGVALVQQRDMPAAGPMLVVVIGVGLVVHVPRVARPGLGCQGIEDKTGSQTIVVLAWS